MSYVDRRGRTWIRTAPRTQQYAKDLRQRMTPAETILWARLRRTQVVGVAFRRQHPYDPYIFDFYCPTVRLIVEVDGGIHDDPLRQQRDAERDATCRGYGLTILRFRNEQVLFGLDAVLETIATTVETLKRQ